jgi:glycosyltransferase involved in cell wall biosynthesis
MSPSTLALVAIGRNEGERLRKCLTSALAAQPGITMVYVDSGSTDGSPAMARGLGCEVVDLDLSIPFTAARARNEGFARALQLAPHIEYVQFVDGDCEIVSSWIATALQFLQQHPKAAAACGRRRERFPTRTVYNQLCDLEWDSPVGQAKYCGGDVLMRVQALQAAGGYRNSLIAGEEPELCVRLRAAGWTIWRLDAEMTLHDAAMTRLSQWWNRSKRAGYAYAEGAWLHGAPPERHNVREVRRIVFWSMLLPTFIVLLGALDVRLLLLALVYPLQVARIALQNQPTVLLSWQRALFLTLGKFAEGQGALKFTFNRLTSKQATLIEYK